jgi:predicted alpha-1,6-mannanase (GH76 family)
LQFDSASTDDLGGGTFWSKKRDFKNTPATAPVALYYARSGYPAKAQALLDWLDARLYDRERGLYQDGLRISATGEVVLEDRIYTYNQGPVLGALLELGGEANLERATQLVAAVAACLTLPAPPPGDGAAILRCEGNGDGGLFTGILVRYLAMAAVDGRLGAETRKTAAALVHGTAEAFWAGRRVLAADDPLARRGSRLIFSALPELPAHRSYPPGSPVELSTQLQAWMVLEAAAAVAGRTGGRAAGNPTESNSTNYGTP